MDVAIRGSSLDIGHWTLVIRRLFQPSLLDDYPSRVRRFAVATVVLLVLGVLGAGVCVPGGAGVCRYGPYYRGGRLGTSLSVEVS